MGFKPATLRMQGTELTTEPARPCCDELTVRNNLAALDMIFFVVTGVAFVKLELLYMFLYSFIPIARIIQEEQLGVQNNARS